MAPTPQSPIPNPQSPIPILNKLNYVIEFIYFKFNNYFYYLILFIKLMKILFRNIQPY